MSTLKSSAENLTLNADGANNDIILQSNASTLVTVDGSASSVGIGETVPLGKLHIKSADSGASAATDSNEVVIEGSGHSGINILSGTSSEGAIYFGDSGDNDIGRLIYTHNGNKMQMWTNNVKGLEIDDAGRVTKPLQPAFCVRPSSTQTDIASGSNVTVVFGTERFDRGSNFSGNTFTAPVTGVYQLNLNLRIQNITDENYIWVRINTSNDTYTQITSMDKWESYPVQWWGWNLSLLVDMDASDTADIIVYLPSGGGQMDIEASSTDFSGFLVA